MFLKQIQLQKLSCKKSKARIGECERKGLFVFQGKLAALDVKAAKVGAKTELGFGKTVDWKATSGSWVTLGPEQLRFWKPYPVRG